MTDLGISNALTTLAYVFGMGMLSSLTPCVYPLIPITVSLFGITPEMSRLRAFLLSLSYVAGMAAMYTTLGMVSAKGGILFGSLLGHPIVVLTISCLLLILALHSLELFQLPLAWMQSRAGKVGGRGASGAFVLGVVSGAVAAPCVGPVLVLILLEAARAPNVWWGALQLFCYAMGMGVLFLVVGTFSGVLSKLPRSGRWLGAVKYLIAIALMVMVFSYLAQLYPTPFAQAQSLAVLSTLAAGWLVTTVLLSRSAMQQRQPYRIASALLLGLIVFEVAIFKDLGHGSSSVQKGTVATELNWFEDLTPALEAAKEQERPLMVDLYAQWCAACKELARTFEDEQVSARLREMLVVARIDLTTESEHTEELQERFSIVGLPSVLFLDSHGNELKELRITGSMSPTEFIHHLNKVGKRL